MSYEIHPLVLAVIPKGDHMNGERVTRIEIEADGDVKFLNICQPGKAEADGVVIIESAEEWEAIDQAVRGALDVIEQLQPLEGKA